MTENEIGTMVVDAAIAVNRDLVTGLLEIVYELCASAPLREVL